MFSGSTAASSLSVGVPVNETLYITPTNPSVPVVCGPSMGLPDGVDLSSSCVLFGTTTPGQSVNVYLDVSNYVARSLALPNAGRSKYNHAVTIASLAAPIHRAVRHQRVRFCSSEPASAEPVSSKPASHPAVSHPGAAQPPSEPTAEPASSQPAS